MNEIEKILKDNMEDYESVKRQALKFIHENKKRTFQKLCLRRGMRESGGCFPFFSSL